MATPSRSALDPAGRHDAPAVIGGTTSVAASVRSMLRAALAQEDLETARSARHVALAFGIHERTLHRRLRAEATTFGSELAHVRFQLAEQLLRETNLQMLDIAFALAYSDSAAFVRAFKRWTGTTPARFRTRGHQDHPAPAVAATPGQGVP